MRVGLFGGSFDPVHRGHIEPVRQALHLLELDRVLYVPTAQPPHKPDRSFAPAYARYTMVELGLLDDAQLLVSAHELTLGRPAYTVETVEHLRRATPGDEFFLLVGADAFAELHLWRRWRDLLEEVTTVVLERPGSDRRGTDLPPELQEGDSRYRIERLANRRVDVSSTALRRALSRGEALAEQWIPRPVLHYINKYHLYR